MTDDQVEWDLTPIVQEVMTAMSPSGGPISEYAEVTDATVVRGQVRSVIDGWIVAAVVARVGSEPAALVSLSIHPAPNDKTRRRMFQIDWEPLDGLPARPLTSTDLRSISPLRIGNALARLSHGVLLDLEPVAPIRRPGVPKTDYDYAVTGFWYERSMEQTRRDDEERLRYVEWVAARPEVNKHPDTVRQELVEARKRGILTKTTPGKAGGNLTDYGRQLIQAGGVPADVDDEEE